MRGLASEPHSWKVHCPFCGATCWAGRTVCDLCGRRLNDEITRTHDNPSSNTREAAPESSDEMRCEHCGVTLLPDSKFCHECGRRLTPSHRASSRELYGEPVKYQERGVSVTSSHLVVGKRPYSLNQITNVDIEIKPSAVRILPTLLVIFLIAAAVWVILYGWQSQLTWVVLLGAIVILFALIGGYRSTTPHHALIIRIGDTLEEVLSSPDAEFVSRVAKAIQQVKNSVEA